MGKSVQIPLELFDNLCSYFLRPCLDVDSEAELWDTIVDQLSSKLDATIRHDLYSQFRRAPTVKEREQARLAYLDAVGMHESFRSPTSPSP